MREAKRKRLEARGWMVGSTAEFLGLSPEEAAYVELRIRLGEALRRWRGDSDLTQAAVARRVGSSQSRVAKMEAGDPSVSLDLLFRALLALGATQEDLGRIVSGTGPASAA